MQARWSGATWRGDGVSGGSYTSGPLKLVIHTTETRTIPGYKDGWVAPHFTYFPAGRYFVQHTSCEVAARALLNLPGGPQTNRDSAIQLEIVCYSAKNIGDIVGGLWVGHLDDDHLRDIAKLVRWVRDEFAIPTVWPGRQALSYAAANASGFRLAPSVWDSFAGVLGHQHVPENTHWDPGALNWARLLQFAQEDDMALTPEQEEVLNEMVEVRRQLKTFGSNLSAIVASAKLVKLWRQIDDIHDTNDV